MSQRGRYQPKSEKPAESSARPKRDPVEIRGFIDADDHAFLAVLAASRKQEDGRDFSVMSVVRGVIQRFVRDRKRHLSFLQAEMKRNGIDLEATTAATEATTDATEATTDWMETIPKRDL